MENMELVPLDDYNPDQTRLESSISWLLTKAYGNDIPNDCRDPFYDDQGKPYLKPSIVNGLVTAKIYCNACRNIFTESTNNWQGHMSVIQALSRKGIYVVEPSASAVTETVLAQTAPFKLKAHLALIEALMRAYSMEVVTIERIVQAVRKFSSFNASSELPYDTEDALLFWCNKVCGVVRNKITDITTNANNKSNDFSIPVLEDLLKDINDGCCLATIISFYCPQILSLREIALKDSLGIADSLHNLQLVLAFCQLYPPLNILHLSINDLFHTHGHLKSNVVAFLSELFYHFEVCPMHCVRDVANTSPVIDIPGATPETRPDTANILKSKAPLIPSVSNATKRSFHNVPLSQGDLTSVPSNSNPDLHSPSKRQPLLPRRLQPSGDGGSDTTDRRSTQAWQDNRRIRDSEAIDTVAYDSTDSQLTNVTRSQGSNLLGNVSIDSDMSFDISSCSSVSLSDFGDTPRNKAIGPILKHKSTIGAPVTASTSIGNPNDNDIDLVSVNSCDNYSARTMEPLMPAKTRPLKENSGGYSKSVESGEVIARSPASPTKHRSYSRITTADNVQNSGNSHNARHYPQNTVNSNNPSHTNGAVNNNNGSSEGSTPDEDYKTPSVESAPLPGDKVLSANKGKQFEAFQIKMEPASNKQNSVGTSLDRHKAVAQSFTMQDACKTPEEAKAAGIPVVDSMASDTEARMQHFLRNTSPRSSSDGSDPELKKIHADHMRKESTIQSAFFLSKPESQRPTSLNVPKPIKVNPVPTQPGVKTSFAQLRQKQLQENGEPMHPSHSLRDKYLQGNPHGTKTVKKTTFAALPNQTTWREVAEKKSCNSYEEGDNRSNYESGQPVRSDLVKIHMKLQERKRQIQEKKLIADVQQQKQRQRVGKEAFLKVISKGKGDSPIEEVLDEDMDADNEVAMATESMHKSPRRTDHKSSSVTKNHSGTKPPSPSWHRSMMSPSTRRETPTQVKLRQNRARSEPPRDNDSKSFSLQGIQATIESVRQRWFGNDEDPGVDFDKARSSDSRPKSYHASLDQGSPLAESRLSQSVHSGSVPDVNSSPQVRVVRVHLVQQESVKQEPAVQTQTGAVIQHTPVQQPVQQPDQLSIQSVLQQEPHGVQPQQVVHPQQPTMVQPAPQLQPAAAQPATQLQQVIAQAAIQPQSNTAASKSAEKPQEYGSSLERLNTSLSELQGQIMRLSLEHDQKKTNYASPTSGFSGAPDPNIIYGGEPDLAGSRGHYSGVTQHQVSGYPHSGAVTYHTPAGIQPLTHPPQVTHPATYPPPGTHYMQSKQYYPGNEQYGHVQSQYHAGSPMYAPPPATFQQPPSSIYPPHQWGAQPTQPQLHSPYQAPVSSIHQTFHAPPASLQTPSQQIPPSEPQQPMTPHTTEQTNRPQWDKAATPVTFATSDVAESVQDTDVTREGEPDNFFVSFDTSSSPKRQKPKLRSERKRENTNTPSTLAISSNHSTPSNTPHISSANGANEGDFTSTASKVPHSPAIVTSSTPSTLVSNPDLDRPRYVSPGVGFVIGSDEDLPKTQLTEIEKKKQKMLQMTQKRREEQEKKRKKLETERERKREEQRVKDELAEQKKVEDKQRRDQIFQDYLKRREERENMEEESKAGMLPVTRRPKPKSLSQGGTKAPRPKSQPASAFEIDDYQGDMIDRGRLDERGRSPAPELIRGGGYIPGDDVDSAYGGLSYGGMTHRRPTSPEKTADVAGYTGPKLFVKPNQKSNRNIVINAISHCCLAGIVNNDVKNKVLEEITRSDAKHFVILFRDRGQQYRSLYEYYPENETIVKIQGVGPKSLNNNMLEHYFKYNSGGKRFTEVTTTKHMSTTIDAVIIKSHYWQKKQPTKKQTPALY